MNVRALYQESINANGVELLGASQDTLQDMVHYPVGRQQDALFYAAADC